VSQPIDLLGKTAAELLLKKIAGNNVPNEEVVLPVSLTIRSTTAVLQQNCEI
jgi:DNA-binding LacI/PurR family transcriptional regulator